MMAVGEGGLVDTATRSRKGGVESGGRGRARVVNSDELVEELAHHVGPIPSNDEEEGSAHLRRDAMRWDAMGCDGMRWDGMRWDEMGWVEVCKEVGNTHEVRTTRSAGRLAAEEGEEEGV
jgi:hypothetical protein